MYYFVVYQWEKHVRGFGDPLISNEVIDEHPLDWLYRVQEEYESHRESYKILWYTEIREEIYEKYKDTFA